MMCEFWLRKPPNTLNVEPVSTYIGPTTAKPIPAAPCVVLTTAKIASESIKSDCADTHPVAEPYTPPVKSKLYVEPPEPGPANMSVPAPPCMYEFRQNSMR